MNQGIKCFASKATFLKRAAVHINAEGLVQNHVDYAATFWYEGSYTKKIDNKGMRIILKLHPYTHI